VIEPCIPLEELARVASLPATDSARRHLDTCPRCRARLTLVRDFESPRDGLQLPDEAAADARMLETIASLTGIASSSPAASSAPRITSEKKSPLTAGRRRATISLRRVFSPRALAFGI